MAPRILVLSASVGAGHMRAAQAVELALRQVVPDATVKNIDVLTLTNPAFRRVYGKLYLDLVNKAPHFLGYFYDMLDQPSRSGRNRGDRFRLMVEKLNLKSFLRLLQEEAWDLVINTHFLPAEIISSLRREGTFQAPQVTATTDFETHRLWVNQPCDRYFTATEEGARYLQHWGIPAKDTFATGIPIHPVFATPKDRAACLKKQGLAGDRPIVLQMSGGFGVGPIEKLYRALLDVEKPLEVVAITGRNEEVKAQLESVKCPPRHRAKVLGFTDQIDELMAVADLVVSKPGGLTTSETLARGAGMVIVNPTPGQEYRNNDFLLENGAAIKVNNIATLAYKVNALLAEDGRLATIRANALRLGRPRAAFDVVEKSLELLKKK
ncbi:MAG TPA: glycosyltransferase [Isosphaeraceae bacterium]|nr:glycosyltransferase [Isosphaeraceae bacterium]